MDIEIDKIYYKYISKNEVIRLLDKIDLMEHNPFYNRPELEKHLNDKEANYCIQFFNSIPLSIGINKFDSFGDNDATCMELQSVIGGYATFFMSHLISDPYVMKGKDIWFMVDSSNVLYERLLRFYTVFQRKFNLKRIDIKGEKREISTFFYSYPCKDEKSEIEFFKSLS